MSKYAKIAIGAISLVVLVGGGYFLSSGQTKLFQGRFSLEMLENMPQEESHIEIESEKLETNTEPESIDYNLLNKEVNENRFAETQEIETLLKPVETLSIDPKYQIKNPGVVVLDPNFPFPELTLNVNNTNSQSKIITSNSGNNSEVILQIDAKAKHDDILIDEIEFEVDLDDNSSNLTPEEKQNIYTHKKIELVEIDPATNTITKQLAVSALIFQQKGNQVITKFNKINSNLKIPKNSSKRFGVRITPESINTIKDSGTQIRLQPIKTSIKARGYSSQNSLPQSSISLDLGNNNNGNISDDKNIGNLFVIRKATPTFSKVTAIRPLTLGTMSTVREFQITPQSNSLQIARFSAEVQGVNVNWPTATNWKIYSANSSANGQCPPNIISTTYKRQITVSNNGNKRYFDFNTPEQLRKGVNRCYAIQVKLSDSNPSGSIHNATIKLINDNQLSTTDKDILQNQKTNNSLTIWTDNPEGFQASTKDKAWVNGFGIVGLPSATTVIK